jgi:cytochrome c peroxidase
MSRTIISRILAGASARIRNSAYFAVASSAVLSTLCTGAVSIAADRANASPARWTEKERATLRSLSIGSLGPLPADVSNRFADDVRAATLGHELFFDARLSGNGKVSCASCHVPSQDFQDAKPLATGMGTTARRTMPIAGTAHSAWLFWDGRADSQWAQALGPLESAVEHGGTRTQYAQVIAAHYRDEYEAVFGSLPDVSALPRSAGPVADSSARAAWEWVPSARRDDISRVYANIGKAIAAYERRIELAPSKFDRYVEAELKGQAHDSSSAFTSDEERGLRLFIGKASCINCHNGALLSDGHFHNTGIPVATYVTDPDSGRTAGVRKALDGEFNCTSQYSDAKAEDCEELRFAVAEGAELVRAFKTPSLRNVAKHAPYMHAGQVASLENVIAHYSSAPSAPFGHSELKPLRLSAAEQRQLIAFLQTLNGPLAAPAGYLEAPRPRQ